MAFDDDPTTLSLEQLCGLLGQAQPGSTNDLRLRAELLRRELKQAEGSARSAKAASWWAAISGFSAMISAIAAAWSMRLYY